MPDTPRENALEGGDCASWRLSASDPPPGPTPGPLPGPTPSPPPGPRPAFHQAQNPAPNRAVHRARDGTLSPKGLEKRVARTFRWKGAAGNGSE